MDITNDAQLIRECVSADSNATCGAGCAWRHGTNAGNGPSPSPGLFTEDFCHPVNVSSTTTDSVWSGCLASDDAAECSNAPGCVFSDGAELIPEHDFCAPMDMTKNVSLIQRCVASNSASTCDEGCQWRHGRAHSDNGTYGPAPLFSEDFCHPVNISKSTPKAVWEACVSSASPTMCADNAGCNWSDGKEFIPDHEFCAPMDLTTNVDLIERCVSAENVTDCNNGCQWRQGRNAGGLYNGSKPLFSTEFCHPANVSGNTSSALW